MKTPKRNAHYKKGDMVRSTFRSRWVGVIEGIDSWSSYKGNQYPIYRVKPVLDPTGRPQPKSIKSRTLSQGWLEPFESNKKL